MIFSKTSVINFILKSSLRYTNCYMSDLLNPPLKKLHTMTKIIGTHNGTFHCDEVLACVMLKMLPEYKESEIVRTRDPSLLEKCDIVVDVGGVYDPAIHRYDHHQRTFKETMNSLKPNKPWVTKLSSAGLIYCHFGHRIILEALNVSSQDPIIEAVYDRVYKNFMEEIDAIDNGISTHDGPPRYTISTNISSRVGQLNPTWKETADENSMKGRFNKAMDLVSAEFLDRLNYYSEIWWPVRALIKEAIENRFKIDEGGEIMILENGGLPWKMHFFELEHEMEVQTPVKYVLYADSNGSYRIQCIPIEESSFELRLALPEPWRGVRDEKLSKLINIPGAIFVHANGFIGGNATREGALEMARQSLKFNTIDV